MIKFLSLSSGSSGNCYFVGRFALEDASKCVSGVLIDAGVSLRFLKNTFSQYGLSTDCFSSILITHDHMDHIRGLGSYCKKLHKTVCSSDTLISAMSRHTFKLDNINAPRRVLDPSVWTEVADGISVRFFVVPHDATQTIGYALRLREDVEENSGEVIVDGSDNTATCSTDDRETERNVVVEHSEMHSGKHSREHRLMIMTDAGRVTDEALEWAKWADTVIFESNYDVDMLMGGSYTHELKMRICGGQGHLSNDECADAIRKFVHPEMRNLFLCHLSENNNTPALAYESAKSVLGSDQCRRPINLRALPRRTTSGLILL